MRAKGYSMLRILRNTHKQKLKTGSKKRNYKQPNKKYMVVH